MPKPLKMFHYDLLDETQNKLDYILSLSLTVENFLKRCLHILIFKSGMAKAYKKLSAVGLWESKKKTSVEAQLKIIEENLKRKKAAYAEKMKNKIADIHRSAEEKRAMVKAQKREEFIELEEITAKFCSSGRTPAKFFA
ncbi:hypothetical protein HN51_066196, partial [Arachis hypogaea]